MRRAALRQDEEHHRGERRPSLKDQQALKKRGRPEIGTSRIWSTPLPFLREGPSKPEPWRREFGADVSSCLAFLSLVSSLQRHRLSKSFVLHLHWRDPMPCHRSSWAHPLPICALLPTLGKEPAASRRSEGLVNEQTGVLCSGCLLAASSQREAQIRPEGFPHLGDSTVLEKEEIILPISNALFLPFT